jgi:hypothetical protein
MGSLFMFMFPLFKAVVTDKVETGTADDTLPMDPGGWLTDMACIDADDNAPGGH